MKLKLLIVCIVVSGIVGLMASPAEAATILYQSANTAIYLGENYASLEFENPLAGTEMIKEYAVKEWMDADYTLGPPRWYDDWSVSDPCTIDGYANEIWMRRRDHSIWTSTTVPSTTVSIHLNGDNNDGLADILVDGILVAKLDMGSTLAQTALIIVKNLANITHHIQVNDRGYGINFGDDVATMGAAALEKRIKWSQPPKPAEADNLYYGWNEISEYDGPQIVADDWECNNDDPITDIHWWGSFINWTSSDDPPVMPSSFHITFWNDVPAIPGDPASFSHPNEVVWEIDCTNFNFNFAGWDYDPRTKCYEACFYFDQFLTEAEYFYQRTNPLGTPNIYWISIAAQYPAGTIIDHPWGWKTRPRDPLSPAPDDAVIIRKPTMPHIGDKYQDGKPIYWPDPNYSWDMAFELTSQTITPVIKWEQPPDTQLSGLHCHDSQSATSGYTYTTIADDWRCDGGLVTDIHWYGNYEMDAFGNEKRGSGVRQFHLSIHDTDPQSTCLPTPLETVGFNVPFTAITETDTGLVSIDGSTIYLYEYDLPTPFPQEQDLFYWLDITANAVDPLNPAIWRWQEAARTTRPSPLGYLCPAVSRTGPIPLTPWQPIAWPDDTYSDMAFAITSTGLTQGYIKWSQPPEPYNPKAYDGWNELSVYTWNQIAADDWFCNTADPVTDIHWWGSFIGWSCEDVPEMPDSFHIAIWTDVPAGADPNPDILYSHPGVVIWETDCNNFTVEFDGWDIDPRNPFYAPPETCYKFSQDLNEDEWFKQKHGNNIYWISIAARYSTGTSPLYPWGWKTRLRDLNSRAPDDAVRIFDPTAPMLGSPYIVGEPIFWPTETESWDLAFELTTKEQPPKQPVPHLKWSQPPIEFKQDSTGTSYKLYATTFQLVDQLLSVNPTTGTGALIGNMSTQTTFGLSDKGTDLYTFDSFDSNSIVKIDPATGNTLQKIVINPPGVTGEGALAFRSDGAGYLTTALGNAGKLWSFDITVPSSAYIGAVTPSMDGMDFDGSDVLYAIDQGSFVAVLPYDLYTINQATGATTLVGSTGVNAAGSGVGGLTFAPDGTLFAALNDNLYTVNPGTGAATLVGPIGFSGVSGLTALPVAAGSTIPVYCGWDEPSYLYEPPGAPSLMKVVADDYLCIGSMPVTSLHWWGSYIDWDLPDLPMQQPDSWQITFWSNVPAGVGAHFSYPEESLHQFRVPNNRVKVEMVGMDEFPLNPDIFPETCFQYYVDLNPYEIFWQEEYIDKTQDNTFWISIVAMYHNTEDVPNPWGWKTRPWSWSDDAVTFNIDDPIPGDPIILDPALITPIEYQGESYDVAFEFDTDPNYIKWEQPFTGIRNWPHYEDVKSMAIENAAGDVQFINLVADDWLCKRETPVTAAVWWGSYIGYEYEACQDTMISKPVKPDYFRLSIWTDVPANPDDPCSFSHPDQIIWKYDAYDYAEVLVGYDKHPIPIPGTDPSGREPVFRYSVRLPETAWFLQEDVNNVYWFSVVAVYKGGTDPTYDWGWTNHPHVFNDDAVTGVLVPPADEWFWTELYDQVGNSEDMSFMLFTEPVCINRNAADYNAWVTWGKPKCWCYQKQCRGDINGAMFLGKPVTGADLIAFKAAFNQPDPNVMAIPDGICADLNHQQFLGKRVTGADLIIFKAYFNKLDALVPKCDQLPIYTGPYNYWTWP